MQWPPAISAIIPATILMFASPFTARETMAAIPELQSLATTVPSPRTIIACFRADLRAGQRQHGFVHGDVEL